MRAECVPGLWSNNLIDTDAALLDICRACANAGPEKCALHESSAELVLQRINNLLNKLKFAPIPAIKQPDVQSPALEYGVVDYGIVKTMILVMLYNTHTTGDFLVNMLAALEKGNTLPWFQLTRGQVLRQLLSCDCPAPGHKPPPFDGVMERTLAIACGDNEIENESFAEVKTVYDDIAKLSSFADAWGIHAACS